MPLDDFHEPRKAKWFIELIDGELEPIRMKGGARKKGGVGFRYAKTALDRPEVRTSVDGKKPLDWKGADEEAQGQGR